MKIETLTEAQKARFPEFVKRWTEIGLCTDPADRPRAEAAIATMYAVAHLPAPRVVWCSSPLAMVLTRAVVVNNAVPKKTRDSVWASVGASVGASVRASVGASVGASVRTSVGASVRASVWYSVGASVWDSVWASVGASVGDSVWASVQTSVGDSVRASVGDSVRASVYGQHDANWLAFYDYFAKELGLVEQTKRLKGLFELSESAGWALPHKNICWVAERHDILKKDDQARLHSETGPAIRYPDIWSIYAWHGVRVPASWIEKKDTLTPTLALGQNNIEQRRAACEIVGWHRVLSELNAKIIDKDNDPEIGELVEVLLPDAGRERFLRVRCGTGREFALSVPPTVQTALEANAWTWNLKPDQYQPEIRT